MKRIQQEKKKRPRLKSLFNALVTPARFFFDDIVIGDAGSESVKGEAPPTSKLSMCDSAAPGAPKALRTDFSPFS